MDQALLVEVAECLGHLKEDSPFCAVIFRLLLLILVLMWRQTQKVLDTSASAVLHLDVKDEDAGLILPQVRFVGVFELSFILGDNGSTKSYYSSVICDVIDLSELL